MNALDLPVMSKAEAEKLLTERTEAWRYEEEEGKYRHRMYGWYDSTVTIPECSCVWSKAHEKWISECPQHQEAQSVLEAA